MKIFMTLLSLITAAQAQTPTPPPFKPRGSALDRPAIPPARATPPAIFPGGAKPVAGPNAARIQLRGTIKHRTAAGVLLQTKLAGNNGLVWLVGMDLEVGMIVDIMGERTGTADCPPGFGPRQVDAYKVALDQSR